MAGAGYPRELVAPPVRAAAQGPRVLVLFDGPETDANPGRIDALYLGNLLGHFTTRRTVHNFESYHAGEWKSYDAVFAIVYRKRYAVPETFLKDSAETDRTFCWLGNQVGQLDRRGLLRRHGIRFERFFEDAPLNQVLYKSRVLEKGDPDTNILRISDPARAQIVASATGPTHWKAPYIVRAGSFWVVTDSPFSYSSENDRYLVFADLLHDILGMDHPEDHRALLRLEDINAMTPPDSLRAVMKVLAKYRIPFAFGFVPTYVNPAERLYFRLTDKPEVLRLLKQMVAEGGTPVLHGYTHQHRGVTSDDYEFFDDLADRPVRGDSELFVTRRLEEAVRESLNAGLYPVTWETPHYAASSLDYRVMRRYFDTVYERRVVANRLGTDQYFPYPVVDLQGQYVIPENLSYIPRENPEAGPLLASADAAWVVRDGYASAFFHPFMKPELLDELIAGILKRGYTFTDLRGFPNRLRGEGRLITNVAGPVEVGGRGRYLVETIVRADGSARRQWTIEVAPDAVAREAVELRSGETYVALRQDSRPPGTLRKLFQVAKGDLSVVQQKLGTILPGRVLRDPVRTVLLWNASAAGEDARDQQSFHATLNSLGFDILRVDVARLTTEELGPFTLLVIPRASARRLTATDVDRIIQSARRGLVLVTDGDSPLAHALGIRLGEPSPVENVLNRMFTSQDIRWPDAPSVPWVTSPGPDEGTVYYADRDRRHPLVVGDALGEGRYLYFAPLFDSITGQGYARFPDFPFILLNEYHISPMLKGRTAEVYFDPGYRQNISIEKLAKMWRRFGIRTVHVAAWHFYDKYTYDYARLVKVAHQNGILVYAWFEWPHVSERFWNRHPNWREKTALLTDARVDWRYLMNLHDPQCLKAVLADAKTFLEAYDWDGVNIAELTFDSPKGPDAPELFTPLNGQARAEFQKSHNFDPLELFRQGSAHFWKRDPAGLRAFYDFRLAANRRLMSTFLEMVEAAGSARSRQMETVVTVLDILQHPELGDYIGVDLNGTLRLLNRHRATLQVEDPAVDWSGPPDRYTRLGRRYAALGLSRPYMIDINILPVHPANQTGFATSQPTGVEMLHLWRAASEQTPRVCLYSESTVLEQDWEVLPYAMAARATLEKDGSVWEVNSPDTVILDVGRGARKFVLDGEPWLAADKGEVWIPRGAHRLTFSTAETSWLDTSQLETRLISLTGDLLGCQKRGRGIEVEYLAATRCALMFSKRPYRVYVDGAQSDLSAEKGDDGYVILGPPGQHRIRVVSESALLFLIESTSLVSASLIVLFGMASSGLLAMLWVIIQIHRRTGVLRARLGRFFSR